MAETVTRSAPRAARVATRVLVARLENLKAGAVLVVEVAGREIGLVRWQDEVFAARNVCPHAAGPVCGMARPMLVAAQAERNPVSDDARPMLVCSWHRWEFDLRTGRALFDPRFRVRTYPTEVDADGAVWVQLSMAPAS